MIDFASQKKINPIKKIAFFDFDGTITTKDSLFEFIKFSKGKMAFYFGFFLNTPFLIAFKLKIISNQRAKQRILKFFFGNTSQLTFQNYCEDFCRSALPSLIRPKALMEIQKLKNSGIDVVIVSASPENWIQPWAHKMKIKLLATCLEIKNEKITGKITGKNCHGKEKIKRIQDTYNLNDYKEIYAYGDSKADLPMMSIATYSFMKPFR